MTKQTRNLLILFLTIFIVKASISFFMSGTYFYSDEACVVIKAKHFAETLQMLPCKEIAHAPGGDPHPLYSLIIAPFFFFFKGFTAYQAVLVFNSLAISSLVFPLYWITKNFIKKEWTALLIITVTLFLPQITVYEKMLLTESFFVFLNIWLLYFYGKYKTEKKDTRKYLLLTVLFTLMAGLERPFGFITSIALITNEIITAKNKKQILLILFPILILISILTFSILGDLSSKIIELSKVFYNYENLKFFIIALKNQLNSLSVSTLFIPIVVFISNFTNKSVQFFNKTKYYLATLFALNFLISANHLYSYIINTQTTDLLTRYINVSIILIIFFAIIFIFQKQKIKTNIATVLTSIIAMTSLIFFHSQTVKHSLNLDLSLFYDARGSNSGNLISQKKIMEMFFFPFIIFLFTLYIFNKKKILKTTFLLIFLFWGTMIYFWNINYSENQNLIKPEKAFFRNTQHSLVFLQPDGYRIANFFIWDQKTLTKNTIDNFFIDTYKINYKEINFYSEKKLQKLQKYNYVISNANFKLPVLKQFPNTIKIYYSPQGQSYEEHIEILKAENKPFIEPSETSKENDPQSTPSLTPQENDKEQS